MAAAEVDQRLRDIQRAYLDFLDDEEDQGMYATRVKTMVEEKKARLVVNINDLRRKSPARATELLRNSFEEIVAFQLALKEYVSSVDPTFAKEHNEFFVAFEGSFGRNHVTPRTLMSHYLGHMVCVEGIVTKTSLVRPKVTRSVHYCPSTKKVLERKYTDLTSYDPFPASSVYPTQDEDGNLLETEYGMSSYRDHQTLSIQEMPEKAPAGQLPRSVDVICDDDLVDLCKPGDRVQIVGNYRCLPGKQGGFTNATFRTVLIANHIEQLRRENSLSVSREDIANCKRLAQKKNVFNLLAKSLAPSIHGHEFVKKAILCMLLGGVEKILPNGSRLRGDINVLLIGDPSVAKSQLLRYVLCTAPRAIPTTGRGSSGVGLTAAVTSDSETGERRLEAGAMVLADRGVVCIDEFDKMSDVDRTAIHEVMEQGRVTIAKAGIQARLNARCSVLAAANPVYGKYDQYKSPMENIGLQDSLLSRFDLLFVMLDLIDNDNDMKISDHVVRMHRYRNPNEQDGEALPMGSAVDMLSTYNPDRNEEEETRTEMYEKYDALLHGNTRSRSDQIISMKFMRKYIQIAKFMKPVLTEPASEAIAEEYSRLRCQDNMESDVARTQPVTARTLETLIRLSTAHAKARLSKKVELQDAEAAIALVQYAYFKKVVEKKKKRQRRHDDESEEDPDDPEGDASGDEVQSQEQQPKRPRRVAPQETQESMETEEQTAGHSSPQARKAHEEHPILAPEAADATSISDSRLESFKESLMKIFRDDRTQSITIDRIKEVMNKEHADPFDDGEIFAAIEVMSDANQVMLADSTLFLI